MSLDASMTAATQIPPPQAAAAVLAGRRVADFHRTLGSISRQSAVYFAGTMFTAAAGYFFKIYLARALGAEALGLYTLGMSVIGLLAVFNAVGLPAAAARFVAEYNGRGEFLRLGSFLRASLALLAGGNLLLGAAVLLLGPWIAVRFYHTSALSSYFWLLAPIMFFGVLNLFLGQVMAGYHDVSRRTIITNFIGTPAGTMLAVVLIGLGFGLKGFLAAQAVSAALVLVLLGVSVGKLTPRIARGAPAALESGVVGFSAVAFGSSALEFVLAQGDKIVIGHYLDAAQVGIYAVAASLVAFVPIALQSVNQIFSPTIAQLHATGNYVVLQQLYATLTKWIVTLTLPLALTLAVFSRPLMAIFGRSFEAGAVVLVIGAAGQVINFGVGSTGYLLMMSGHQVRLMKIQICNAVFVISTSLLLVPRFGIAGAAVASAAAVAFTNLWSLTEVYRRLKLFPYNLSYLKLLPAAAVSFVVLQTALRACSTISSSATTAVCGLLCAYVSFLGTLAWFGLDREDRRIAELALKKLGFATPEIGGSRP